MLLLIEVDLLMCVTRFVVFVVWFVHRCGEFVVTRRALVLIELSSQDIATAVIFDHILSIGFLFV